MKIVQLLTRRLNLLQKTKVLFAIVLGVLFTSYNVRAQNNTRAAKVKSVPTYQAIFDDVSIKGGVGLVDFYGDVQLNDRLSKPSLSGNFSINKEFARFFGAGLRMQFGEMAGKRDYYHLNNGSINPEKPVFETFENHYINIDLTASIHLGSLLKQQTHTLKNKQNKSVAVFDPYIFAGIGGIFYNVEVTTTYDRTENAEIPETTIRNFRGQKDLTIPLGAGIKYYVNSKWSLGAEGVCKFVPSDMLDGTFRKYYQTSDEFANDRFSYIGFNLGYTFRYKA